MKILQVTPHKSPFEKGGFRGIFKTAPVHIKSPPAPLFQRGEQLLVGSGPAQPGGALINQTGFVVICIMTWFGFLVCLPVNAFSQNDRLLSQKVVVGVAEIHGT
jgi:hypothetical protein